ncbi:hypothetical protein FACS189461_3490 [Spirochaetia bacterium]|nr:hypothetical protein FACS189461_3490 [Spirochaetia bacterium]
MKSIVTRLYLSGAISEDADYAAKFHNAAEQLRSKGFTVLNPVELGHVDKAGVDINGSWELHLMRDLCAMLGYGITSDACQGIALIPYEESGGADLECSVAEALDFYIMTVDEWLAWTGDEYAEPVWRVGK